MSELFIELYSEEIPLNCAKNIESNFKKTIEDTFINLSLIDKIDDNFCEIYTTPCRIIIYIKYINDTIKIKHKEIVGPKITSTEEEINGFLNAFGLKSKECLSKNDTNYILIQNNIKANIKDILQENMPDILSSLASTFTQNMMWNNLSNARWVSPLRNILCLYNNNILEFEFNGLRSNNLTYGHKILVGLDKTIKINSFNEYKAKMEENFVIFNQNERKKIIENKIKKIESESNQTTFILNELNFKENLINDIVNTTEYPDVFIGEFKQEFLKTPTVITTNIICKRYKSFCLIDNISKNLSNKFIFFVNTKVSDNGEYIAKCINNAVNNGLEFINLELVKYLSESLESKINKLKSIPYYKDFGTVYNNIERLIDLSKFICLWTPHCDLISTKEAAKLSKIDLTSTLVRDNPELMGHLSAYYAKSNNYPESVYKGIEEFYEPRHLSDRIPSTDIGKVISIAGRMDIITTLFIVNEEATGSKDPYSIRKNITAVIRTIIESKVDIPINILVHKSISLFRTAVYKKNRETKKISVKQQIIDIENKILDLFKKRFINYMADLDYKQNIIYAVINFKNKKTAKKPISLDFLYNKVVKISKYIEENEVKFLSIKNTYKRLNNILYGFKINEMKSIIQKIFNKTHIKNNYEKAINLKIKEVSRIIKKEDKIGNYEKCLNLLLEFTPLIDKYFKDNLIKTDNAKETNNRLFLLYKIKNIFDNFLNFSEF